MSAINSVTFDKPSYAPGDKITVTAQGNWDSVVTVTITTADGATGQGQVTVIESVSASDTQGRIWAPVSNTGIQAVFTATA